MIFCGFMLLTFVKEKYSDVAMMIMFLCIVVLSILRAYFTRERLRAYNRYSAIIRHNAGINRRLEMIMMELESLPLDTLVEEVPEPRNLSKEIINTLPHIEANEEGHCSICLDNIACEQKVTILPCTHKFHSTCVDNWLLIKAVCPICKTRIN